MVMGIIIASDNGLEPLSESVNVMTSSNQWLSS